MTNTNVNETYFHYVLEKQYYAIDKVYTIITIY